MYLFFQTRAFCFWGEGGKDRSTRRTFLVTRTRTNWTLNKVNPHVSDMDRKSNRNHMGERRVISPMHHICCLEYTADICIAWFPYNVWGSEILETAVFVSDCQSTNVWRCMYSTTRSMNAMCVMFPKLSDGLRPYRLSRQTQSKEKSKTTLQDFLIRLSFFMQLAPFDLILI